MIKQIKTSPWQTVIYLRDLVRELVSRDIKLRYRRSILGVTWSLINPLAQFLVFHFVPNYSLFLFIGLVVWNWFQVSLLTGTGAIVENRELIKRPGFPAGVLPIVTVMTNFIHFLLALPIVFIFVLWNQIEVTSAILALPVLFIVQFLLILSLVYIAAMIHVTFRDTQYLLGILLLLGFYLSPIIYDSSAVPIQYQFLYRLNPLVTLIEAYRAVLMQGDFPNLSGIIVLGILSIVLLMTGYYFFKRSSQRFVEEL
jgi:lipopolysaccharide transport system permease protein